MKYKNKKQISLVLSTILISSIGLIGGGALAGCSGNSSSSTESTAPAVTTPPSTTKTVSGVAVDGYIKLATVTLNGVTTQTNDVGIWSMAYIGNSSHVISVKGGIDTSTNKPFEGTLKAELGADGANVAVTPLSTLVSSLVQRGVSKAAASTKIATQLGISEATLAGDPIAILTTGTTQQKSEAASAMKSILVVQKAAEAFAKSMGDAGSDNYEATFAGMYDVIATQLNNAVPSSTPSASAFDAVMADTSTITTALQTNLAATVTDPLMNDRLQAASSSVENIISAVQSISNENIANNADSAAKAVEQLTTLIENKLVEISSATDIAAIGTAQTDAAVVTEQNNITNLVNDYTTNPDLGITNTVVAPPVVTPTPTDPVVTPPVVAPTDPVVTPPVVDPTDPVVTPPVVTPTDPVVTPPVVTPTDPVVTPTDPIVTPPVVTPTDPVVTPTPTTQAVSVTAAGSSDASTLASTYTFTAGTYTYAITGFNDGDVLDFPDGNNPTIINTSATDASIVVQWAYSGNVITVNLTIPVADDAAIYGTTSFKTAFATTSIQ